MGKPELSVVEETDIQKTSYELTLLQSQQPHHYYAKLLDRSELRLPFWNKHKRVQYDTFEELARALDSLLNKPLITQILGAPISTLSTADKVRRTAQNFSFSLPGVSTEAPITISYNYLILDIDKAITPYHSKIKQRLNEFKQAYEEYDVDEDLLHKTVRAILAHTFRKVYKGPIYFRASASFGKSKSPWVRGHIYIPLSTALSIDELAAFTYAQEHVDHTPYFNSTQPIFTAAPIKYANANLRATNIKTRDQADISPEDESPLALFPKLKRSYYWPGNEESLDVELIQKQYSQEILTRKEYSPSSKLLPATELSGKRGAFNRVARSHEKFSIDRWLTNHGYVYINGSSGIHRYLSPYSQSGSAGAVVFPDGYLVDFHESSPLKDIIDQNKLIKDKKIFTAYDLWYLDGVQLENPNAFKRMVDQAIALDPLYQKVWHEKLDMMTTFISSSLSPQDIDEIIRGILEEVFYAGLKEDKRHRVFEAISAKVASLKIKDFKRPVSKLQKLFKEVTKDFAAEYATVHPANTDTQNAKSFVEATQLFKMPDGTYVAENTKGDMLTLLRTEEELQSYAQSQIPRKSNAPLDWTHGKIVSTAKTIVLEIRGRAEAGEQSSLRVSEELYMLKGTDKRRAINFKTGELHSPLLNEFIIKELPFTQEEYDFQKEWKFEETHWGQFLMSSFEGYEANIEHIRDLMTFIMMPERPGQSMFGLIGITRSGKSTIKNILSQLLGRKFAMEKMFKDLNDQFALSELTQLTRLFTINEFNIGTLSRAATQDAVNFLKALSGDDSVTVRRMHTDPNEVHPVAVPLLVSNETPHINDPAFIARLRVIKFRRSFLHAVRNTLEFQENLKKELPFIFEWLRTNPRYKDGKLEFLDSEVSRQDLAEVEEEADPVGTFCKLYVEENPKGSISRTELGVAFKHYWEMTMGEDPPEGYQQKFLSIPILRSHLHTLQHRRQRRWIKKKEYDVLLPEAKAKLGGYKGVKETFLNGVDWKDKNTMTKHFSPFSDLPDNYDPEEEDDL